MTKRLNLLTVSLASLYGATLLSMMLIRAFLPHIILPRINAELIFIISLAAIVIEHYISRDKKRSFLFVGLSAAFIFGVFPYAACFLNPLEALKSGILGGIIFSFLSFLFDSAICRLRGGRAEKIAPIALAFTLFLSAGCLFGII